MSNSMEAIPVTARGRRQAPWFLRRLYTSNPFYVISADLVFIGLRMSFDTSGQAFETGALMLALAGYTLLLATTAVLLIRHGNVWDDVRTILLLVVAMFLAISVTFDETLARSPRLGAACFGGGLAFAVLVSEGVLRGIRLRLPLLYRVPYYLILALFFLYPLALSPFLNEPDGRALQWLLFGFSTLAGLAFLTLIPAIRRGAGYVSKNGSPWPYPLYPWSLFGLLAAAVCGRASYLCTSLHFVGMSHQVGRAATIFGPYFLIPFLLALAVLLIEAASVSRNRVMQGVALALLPGIVILSTIGHRTDPVYRGFLRLFEEGLGGTPLYLSVIAVAALYGHAALRRLPGSVGGLTASLLVLAFVGPTSLDPGSKGPDGLVAARAFPLLAASALQLGLAIRHRSSWRSLSGACCLIGAITAGLPEYGLADRQGLVAFHLVLLAASTIGAIFNDELAGFLRRLAAFLLVLACQAVVWEWRGLGSGFSPALVQSYPLLAIAFAGVYYFLTTEEVFLTAALVCLAGWVTASGWRSYRDLRRLIVGLDWIVSGLAFFVVAALISLTKTGLPARWLHRRERALDCPSGNVE
jgi:hypothetical protein